MDILAEGDALLPEVPADVWLCLVRDAERQIQVAENYQTNRGVLLFADEQCRVSRSVCLAEGTTRVPADCFAARPQGEVRHADHSQHPQIQQTEFEYQRECV